jgi:hypothetical protein
VGQGDPGGQHQGGVIIGYSITSRSAKPSTVEPTQEKPTMSALAKEARTLLQKASEMFEETGCVPGSDGEEVPAETMVPDAKEYILATINSGLYVAPDVGNDLGDLGTAELPAQEALSEPAPPKTR